MFLAHSKTPELLFVLQLTTQGRMASVFFLFFFSISACLTPMSLPKEWHADFGSFASLLVKRSQTFPCMLRFALNQRADFVGLRRQAMSFDKSGKQVGWTHTVLPPNKLLAGGMRGRGKLYSLCFSTVGNLTESLFGSL